jgi:hypothetical protein
LTAEEALAALAAARRRGWDWVLHTSWCSDLEVYILRVRAPGVRAQASRTRVGGLEEVLRWGAAEVGGGTP